MRSGRVQKLCFESQVLVSAGVDWLTVTQTHKNGWQRLHEIAEPMIAQERSYGNVIRPWSSYGYEGFHCGRIDVGSRHDGQILRLSGDRARTDWSNVLPFASSCSRIDVQITVRYTSGVRPVLAKVYRAARRHRPDHGKPAVVSLLNSSDGSCTIYLGKRSSDRMGRAYDKGVESKLDHYQNCARFEGEFKGRIARSVAHRIYHAADRDAAAIAECLGFFAQRGVRAGLIGIDSQVPLLLEIPSSSPNVTDAFKSLQWLNTSVAPSVRRLIDMGHLGEALEALGISGLVQPV